jgi:hypothetical protein
MPLATMVLVRAALVHLVVGAVLGMLLLGTKAGYDLPALMARAWPIHAEMLLLGWMAQLALGVAFWILPKHATVPVRGPVIPVLLAAVLLNVGVLAAGLGLVLDHATLTIGGRVMELVAVLLFAINAVPRVKRFGRA